jgi:quercetin dioxygenase-like cupin family protein
MDRAAFQAGLARDGYQAAERSMAANVVHEEHAHGFDARLLILQGEMTIVCGAERHTYRAGETFDMPAGRRHSEHVGPEGVTYVAGRPAAG